MKSRDIRFEIQEAQKEVEVARNQFNNAIGTQVDDGLTRLELAEGNLSRLYELAREAEYSELQVM